MRKIAAEQNLVTAGKKDSQGLCFIGKVKLPTFLQQQLEPKKGNVVELEADYVGYNGYASQTLNQRAVSFEYDESLGEVIGEHDGAYFYTIGQRKGLGIGGKAEPLFVIGTDTNANTIYVGMGEDHPGLKRNALRIEHKDVHWVRPDLRLTPGMEMKVGCRIRYRQPMQEARLICTEEALFISFEEMQQAIASGQFAAWYLDDELIGSGVID